MDAVDKLLQLYDSYLIKASEVFTIAFKAMSASGAMREQYRKEAIALEEETNSIKKEMLKLWNSGGENQVKARIRNNAATPHKMNSKENEKLRELVDAFAQGFGAD